jgi:hypothetical protein
MKDQLENVLGYIGLEGSTAKIVVAIVVVVGGALVALWKKRKSKA